MPQAVKKIKKAVASKKVASTNKASLTKKKKVKCRECGFLISAADLQLSPREKQNKKSHPHSADREQGRDRTTARDGTGRRLKKKRETIRE